MWSSKFFLGETVITLGPKHKTDKMEKFMKTVKVTATVRQLKRLVGFILFFRSFLSILAKNLMRWYKVLRKVVEFGLQDDHLRSCDTIKSNLLQATLKILQLRTPGQKNATLCDPSYYFSGFLMKEDFLVKKEGQKNKTASKHRHIFRPTTNFLISFANG